MGHKEDQDGRGASSRRGAGGTGLDALPSAKARELSLAESFLEDRLARRGRAASRSAPTTR
jgi:hypothetical protein